MTEMVLIDTSVWIKVLRLNGELKLQEKVKILLTENHAAVYGIIIMELLSGVRNKREYAELGLR